MKKRMLGTLSIIFAISMVAILVMAIFGIIADAIVLSLPPGSRWIYHWQVGATIVKEVDAVVKLWNNICFLAGSAIILPGIFMYKGKKEIIDTYFADPSKLEDLKMEKTVEFNLKCAGIDGTKVCKQDATCNLVE